MMTMFRRYASLAGLSALVVPALVAAAPPPASVRFIRGTIVTLGSNQVQVKTGGKVETINLAPEWTVQVTKPISVAEIKPGSFIGTAEMPQKDGTGRSLEVHVFPPGVKAGEGHYSWGLKKGSMMTNGTVGKVAASPKGQSLQVSYPTGQRSIVVPPRTPVVQIVPGTRDLARPGARVFIGAMPTPRGLMAASIQLGVNGAAPPM